MYQVYLMKGGSSAEIRKALYRILPDEIKILPFPESQPVRGTPVILPERLRLSQNTAFFPGTPVIVSSEESAQLQMLSAFPVRVIACGRRSRDTVTFSSCRNGSAVVSLMRELEGTEGVIEPMDLPLAYPRGCGDYPVLAAAAVRIYSRGGF